MAAKLREAVQAGNVDKIRNLVESGVSPDATTVPYLNPLYLAIIENKEDAVNTLIQLGADVNKRRPGIGEDSTPLHSAAAMGVLNIAKMLIDAGADINLEDRIGHTPLIRAIVNYNIDMVKLLIANGANINTLTRNNESPLYIAATRNNPEIIKLLISQPSLQNPKLHDGMTVIDMAREGRFSRKINTLIINTLPPILERRRFNKLIGATPVPLKENAEPTYGPFNKADPGLLSTIIGPFIGPKSGGKRRRRKTRATRRRHHSRTHKRRV